jgi:hypothetical protein
MSADSNPSHAAESPPIIVFQSRALRIQSVADGDFGCSRGSEFSTPRKRPLTDASRTPTHISKRSRLCASGGPSPSFELRVEPVNMSFVLSGSAPCTLACTQHLTRCSLRSRRQLLPPTHHGCRPAALVTWWSHTCG